MTAAEFLYVTLIDAPREVVWRALTLPEFTKQYWHETEVQSDWKVGSTVRFMVGDEVGCEGEVFICRPYEELSYGWRFPRNPECAAEAPSRVTFLLENVGGATKLTLRHDQFTSDESPTYKMVAGGWPYVLAGLKTLCEKGKTPDFSAHYG